ncbi:MAG: triple tyrosine motif-containing protein [Melioribacteraceae bacterium]
MIKRYIKIFFFLSFTILYSQFPQNGLTVVKPFLQNFTPNDYNGGTQNWCAIQDESGLLYFGNQKGILQYDGINWRLIDVNDGKAVFELTVDSSNTIWCGTQDDIGFLKSDLNGQLKYNSITHLIPDNLKPIGKVRQISATKEQLFFSTGKYFFQKTNNEIASWKSETSFYRHFLIENQIHIYENKNGLKTFYNDSLVSSHRGNSFEKNPITSVVQYNGDTVLISSWKDGLFFQTENSLQKFKTEVDQEFKKNPIIDVAFLPPNKFVLAGFNKGSYIINNKGKLLRKNDKSSGLINELCNDVFLDKSNALWLCNNYGISRLEVSTPFTFFDESDGLTGNIIFIKRHKNNLYVATDDKLYYFNDKSNTTKPNFEIVPDVQMCWSILPVEDELLVAANYGVYIIKNNKSQLIILEQKKAFTLFRSKVDTNKIYVGTEMGLAKLKYDNGKWNFGGFIKGIKEEIRRIQEMQDGTLWLGTLGNGIIRCSFNSKIPQVEYFNKDHGLPELKYYRITLLQDEPYFASPYSPVMRFDLSSQKFYPDTLLFNKNEKVSRIIKDDNENIWVRKITKDGEVILFGSTKEDSSYTFNFISFKRINKLNTKFIYPDQNGITWFGYAFGMIKYDSKIKYNIPKINSAQIRKVKFQDSTYYYGSKTKSQNIDILKFPYKNNSFRFEFALPSYEIREAISFQYYLKGYEDEYSNWTKETQKDYTNLSAGTYQFYVRGKDIYGSISDEDFFEFVILPPWYQATSAYIIYSILLLASIFSIDRIRKKQIDKKHKIELDKQLKIQRTIEKAKRDERQLVRKKTATDFHDELGHVLTKITLFTEMAKRSTKENIEAQKYLNDVSENASHLSSGMKDLIWTLDTDKDNLHDTLLRIKDFGDSLFEHSSVVFRTKGLPKGLDKITMSMEDRKDLVLLFKEAMNNCLKHAESKSSEFSVIESGSELTLCFCEDGKGFDSKIKSKGAGLKNMKMRAKKMNAKFHIESKPAETKITLVIDLKEKY